MRPRKRREVVLYTNGSDDDDNGVGGRVGGTNKEHIRYSRLPQLEAAAKSSLSLKIFWWLWMESQTICSVRSNVTGRPRGRVRIWEVPGNGR